MEEGCDNHGDIFTPTCVQTFLIVLDTSMADLGQTNPHPNPTIHTFARNDAFVLNLSLQHRLVSSPQKTREVSHG